MTRLLTTLFLLVLATASYAQVHFSYVSDKKFNGPEELLGYTLHPNEMEIPDGRKNKLDPGEISFYITPGYLFVEGLDEFKGKFSVNSINTIDYGYKMALMNANKPSEQGHLKIVINDFKQVDALIFKRSREAGETIFYMAIASKKLEAAEAEYFTDKNELSFGDSESIWGTKLSPYYEIKFARGVSQKRLYVEDSLTVAFIETIEIIEKGKKEKEEEEVEDTEEEVVELAYVEQDDEEEDVEEEDDKKKKGKGKKSIYDEDEEDEEDEYDSDDPFRSARPKKQPKEEVEEVVEIVEEVVEAPIDEATEIIGEGVGLVEEVKDPKIKEKIVRKIILRFYEPSDPEDPYSNKELVEMELPVVGYNQKSDKKSGNSWVEFSVKNFPSKTVLVFLTESGKVSHLEMGAVTYYMRGH